jgi:hypothetical protein
MKSSTLAAIAASLVCIGSAPAMAGNDRYPIEIIRFAGEIISTASTSCPLYFSFPTDGRSVPVMTYSELFLSIGYKFGGNGHTTFMLPNIPDTVDTLNGSIKHCIVFTGSWRN